MLIPISPVTILNSTGVFYQIIDYSAILGTGPATVRYQILDANMNPLITDYDTIVQSEYAAWNEALVGGSATSLPASVVANVQSAQLNNAKLGGSSTLANTDGYVLSLCTAHLNIAPLPDPVISSPSSFTAPFGQPFSFQIVASNGPTNYSVDTLPSGLALDPVAGIIAGTPLASGSYTSNISVANLTVVTQALSITVA